VDQLARGGGKRVAGSTQTRPKLSFGGKKRVLKISTAEKGERIDDRGGSSFYGDPFCGERKYGHLRAEVRGKIESGSPQKYLQ